MKRIRGKKGTGKIKENALKQFRETRDKLQDEHPELLFGIREKLLSTPQEEVPASISRDVPVDRQKNMETVLKFLETNPNFMGGDLKGLLSGKYH